jgi:hypothetical protein
VFKKSMVIAAPVLASAAIVAAGLGVSTQADASGHKYAGPALASHKSDSTTKCDAGVQKRTFNRGVSGWIYAGSDSGPTIMPGSIIRVHGPQSGKDVLSVNLSAASYLDSGSTGRVKVLLDGVPMAPADLNTGSLSYNAGYSTFAQNYCRKIGPGAHNMRVVISDDDGGNAGNYYWELSDPMVHVEQSD